MSTTYLEIGADSWPSLMAHISDHAVVMLTLFDDNRWISQALRISKSAHLDENLAERAKNLWKLTHWEEGRCP